MLEEDIPDIHVAKYIKRIFINKKLHNLNWGLDISKLKKDKISHFVEVCI
jgi:hypothetical protein